MLIKSLKLFNFKNYESANISFANRLNCFVGNNGMGKTNLLDAIYYLCLSKSHFGQSDKLIIKHDEDFFRIEGFFEKHEQDEHIVVKFPIKKRKVIERNKVPYTKASEHVGLLPVIMITPNDTIIATSGSEERRKLLNNHLCQVDQQYLKHLITYNKLLNQRNTALKSMASEGNYDASLIEIYNQQMIPHANYIHSSRQQIMNEIVPIFQKYYDIISNGQEKVNCTYASKLSKDSFENLLAQASDKDRILQRTTVGIHKDDLIFEIADYPLKKFASQGQLKSYILALKIAFYAVLKHKKGVAPLLLLDDIFDKLDKSRVEYLLRLLTQDDFGQLFITDTHEDRVTTIAENLNIEYAKYLVINGIAKPI